MLAIVVKRKFWQETCELGYDEGGAMLQYSIRNKNAIKVKTGHRRNFRRHAGATRGSVIFWTII